MQTTQLTNNRDKEKSTFLENGFACIDNMICDEELEILSKLYDRCFAPEQMDQSKALGGTDKEGRQTLPQILSPSKLFPELLNLSIYKKCKEITKDFFEDTDITLRGEHMILKPAAYGAETPWHQDQAYHDPSLSYRNINFWFPIDGATEEEGALQFVKGSHKGSVVMPHTHLIEGDEQSAMVAVNQSYWQKNGTVVPCPRGSCTLHHSYCLHAAGPNYTNRDRRAFIIVFGVQPKKLEQAWHFPWRKRE